ncbi:unknown [Odoribacter sp. CAG:788]|jgi:hypothetical protein|nr:unknown [Odoribacter sp. CAG:788]
MIKFNLRNKKEQKCLAYEGGIVLNILLLLRNINKSL